MPLLAESCGDEGSRYRNQCGYENRSQYAYRPGGVVLKLCRVTLLDYSRSEPEVRQTQQELDRHHADCDETEVVRHQEPSQNERPYERNRPHAAQFKEAPAKCCAGGVPE